MDYRTLAMAILFLFGGFHIRVSILKEVEGELVIGIDLGTKSSSIGFYRNGKVKIIANEPSYVAFTADNERLIGESAMNQALSNIERTVFDIKRLIGRKFEEETVQKMMKMLPDKVVNKTGKPYVEIKMKDGEIKAFSPEEISAMVLSKMKVTAESYLGRKVKLAVISVPAYFNKVQKQATKDAGTIAGFEVLRLIDEPTAAALAYNFDTYKYWNKNFLVYSLGGGIFDATILSVTDGGINVLSKSSGDTHLEGEDFDHRLMEHFIKIFKEKHGKDMSKDDKALAKLRKECEKAKRELSSQHQVSIDIVSLFDGIDFSETLDRATFEELNEDLFKETLEYVKKAMEDARLKKSEIDQIVLVGGSTRIPKVQELLKEFFDRKEPIKGLNPDEVVAYGAAIQAVITRGYLYAEVNPKLPRAIDLVRKLGIETEGGVIKQVIRGNIVAPVKSSTIITTYQDLQTEVEIRVFADPGKFTKHCYALGKFTNLERFMATNCSELGKFNLSNIAPAPRGVPQIEVTIEVDWFRNIQVTAEDKGTKNKQSITIKDESDRLPQEVIDEMVKEAEPYAEESRQLALKQKSKLEYCIFNMTNAIEDNDKLRRWV